MSARLYSRWVRYDRADRDCRYVCEMPRAAGMRIVTAFRVGLSTWNVLGLYGTPAQMHETEARWDAIELEVRRYRPRAAERPLLTRDRTTWAESTVDWEVER